MSKLSTDEPLSLSSKWSSEFVDFVSKCLVKEVEQRWSVDQLIDVWLLRRIEA